MKVKNHKFLRTVAETISGYNMFEPYDSVLIGLSGGPDSIALLHIMLIFASRLSLRLGIAHLNHSLRGHDSDNDAEFVLSVAGRLNLPCYNIKEDVSRYKLEKRISLEEAAREVRYDFFLKTAKKHGFNRIALGHQCDDNAELVLMYIFRGSGPCGISGIPPVRCAEGGGGIRIVRPLIKTTRSEIINFLNSKGIDYVIDSSNSDTGYLRNRIRHELIPHIRDACNPNIVATLNRLSSIIRVEEEWIENTLNPLYENSVLSEDDKKIALSVEILDTLDTAAKRRIIRKAVVKIKGDLRHITLAHIDSVSRLLEKGSCRWNIDFPDRIRVCRKYDRLIVVKEKTALRDRKQEPGKSEPVMFQYSIKKPEPGKPFLLFIKEIKSYIRFTCKSVKQLPDFCNIEKKTCLLDMDALTFPLLVRSLRAGDRFSPLGMTGTQKVGRYFINNKVPQNERGRTPVMLSRRKIVWVAGHQIDGSMKVLSSTKNILEAELSP